MLKKTLCLSILLSAFSLMAGETFEIDPGHSFITFQTKHLNIGTAIGRFTEFTGALTLDQANPSASSFQVTIKAESVNTDSVKRDKHLRNADFFNTGEFKEISFKSSKVEMKGNLWLVTGDMSMLGTTKPVTISFEKTGEGKDPWGSFRVGLLGQFSIKRSDFGMNFGIKEGTIGDEVKITVAVEGMHK